MGHCRGGDATLDRFDLLSPLVEWVEEGKAPESVIATGSSLPAMSRPLCAWPRTLTTKGKAIPARRPASSASPEGSSRTRPLERSTGDG